MPSLTQNRPLIALTTAGLLWGGSAFAQSTATDATTESDPPAATSEASAPAAATETPNAATVVATVNGTKITLAEVIAVRQGLPEQYQELPDEVLMTGLVQQMADQILLENAAIAEKLHETTAVRLAIQTQRRAVLADSYMTDALVTEVTEEALAAAYKAQFVDVEPVVEVRAGHILVPEQTKADELKALIDGGADFAALAAEHGTDGTASRGGDLGWFTHDQMVPEFADAAFAMEPGTISAPVQSPFGWHLIKLEEKRDRPAPPLEEVRGDLINELSAQASETLIAKLRGTATIELLTDGLAPAAIRDDALLQD